MTRLRTDQACLDAQVRAQVEQKLNAELAGERRDTERCPPPANDGTFDRIADAAERILTAAALPGLQQYNAQAESLTRAAARAFAENIRTEVDRAFAEPSALSQIKWADAVPPGATWTGEGSSVRCPICDAEPGAMCSTPLTGPLSHAHWLRAQAEAAKTPTASDCAPAIAPEAVNGGVAPSRGDSGRPVCACGQTIWNELTVCGDCRAENVSALLCMPPPAPLDKRIAETKSDDATECAWSTPTSEGEGWT